MTAEPQHTASKKMVPHSPAVNYHEISIMLHCHLCSTCYTALYTNQELFEKHLCNQSIIATMKNTAISVMKGGHHALPPNQKLFAVSKDEWDTKEDTGECIVHTAVCQKHMSG